MNLRRPAILRELGLGPIWRLRTREAADVPDAVLPTVPDAAPQARPDVAPEAASDVLQSPAASGGLGAAVGPPTSPVDLLGWDALEAEIRKCTACPLHARRKQAVPGIGDRQPDWLLVGEGPGAEEDQRGEPFVGPAGQLLDAMLFSIGLSRSRGVFIANAVKCRPPGNRTPEAAEIASCFPYLARQVALLQPRLILALGRPAAQSLLNREVKIADVRGRSFSYAGIPLVVTYHPAYLLRNPHDKGKAWEDLCFARALVPPTHD